MITVTFTQLGDGVRVDAGDGITAQMFRAFSDLCGYPVEAYEEAGLPAWNDATLYTIERKAK